MKTAQEQLEEQMGIVRSAIAEIETIKDLYDAKVSEEQIYGKEDSPKLEKLQNDVDAIQSLAEELESVLSQSEMDLDI
jgi:hypothetical protein